MENPGNNKYIKFLRKHNLNAENLMFMSLDDGLKLFDGDREPDLTFKLKGYEGEIKDEAFEGMIQYAGYKFFFINPAKL